MYMYVHMLTKQATALRVLHDSASFAVLHDFVCYNYYISYDYHNMTNYGVYSFNNFSPDGKKKISQAVKQRKSAEGMTEVKFDI